MRIALRKPVVERGAQGGILGRFLNTYQPVSGIL
jgi:hypothetical protein